MIFRTTHSILNSLLETLPLTTDAVCEFTQIRKWASHNRGLEVVVI